MNMTNGVIIIVAGFSELSVALKLRELSISAIILEARSRVGGRNRTIT